MFTRKGYSTSLFIILALSILTLYCSSAPNVLKKNKSVSVVGTVGSEIIEFNDLMQGYMSGGINQNPSAAELKDFLPIYLNYRAKLLAASEAGYFENKTILDEYAMYAKQAAYAYWLDREIKPTIFEQFKSRYNEELKSSHVLISLLPLAPPSDTLAAYNRIMEARELFLSGERTMAELNEEYSSTRNGQLMGGDLPWFSVGVTVGPFEDALYALEEGELSMPVRTQFGYHIIHLEERRERTPARNISHIFISRRGDIEKMQDLYEQLEQGTPWMNLVVEFSEDRASVSNEGNIGWVSYSSRYDQAFIDSVMNLDPSLPYSRPIESTYGVHIFRVDSVQTFKNEAAKDEFLTQELDKSSNFERSNEFVLNWLSEQYKLRVNTKLITNLTNSFTSADSLPVTQVLDVADGLSSDTLFAFQGGTVTAADFYDYLMETHSNKALNQVQSSWFSDYQEYFLDSELANFTLNVFPEFSEQTDSYHRGLVVYQINEDSVWSSVTIDSTLLMVRYLNNNTDYQFDTRYYYHLVSARYDSTLKKAEEFIVQGGHPDSLRANDFPVAVMSDSTGIFQGEPFTRLAEMEVGNISEYFTYNNRKAFFVLNDVLPARKMTFDEAFNRLLSDYQPIREENWLQRLRNKYQIQSYPEVIDDNFATLDAN
ncbi:peptidylprolyl isomerase [Balneolaceae bacterium]|nr:peptidylprolyl isomerase [Balneolaceae bacterium]